MRNGGKLSERSNESRQCCELCQASNSRPPCRAALRTVCTAPVGRSACKPAPVLAPLTVMVGVRAAEGAGMLGMHACGVPRRGGPPA